MNNNYFSEMIHPEEMVTNKTYRWLSYVQKWFPEFKNDPTVKIIYGGAVGGPNCILLHNIDENVLRSFLIQAVNHDTKIFIDNMTEGIFFYLHMKKIHNAIEGTNINPNQIYYFSSTINGDILYKNFCEVHNISKCINIYGSFIFENNARASKIRDRFNIIKKKEKIFLCFNRIIREHRYALLGLLLEKKLVEKSFYSFTTFFYGNISFDIDTYKFLNNFLSEKTCKIAYDQVNSIKHLLPLKLNIEPDYNKTYLDSDDIPYYDNSYFSLVTETGFFHCDREYKQNVIFFSEKIFKPILVRHPFILVSAPHSLKYLRKIGYQTFSPYINEEYDEIENDEDRLLAIVAEVERLSKYTDEQWIEWQNNVDGILEHNHKIMRERKDHEYAFRG